MHLLIYRSYWCDTDDWILQHSGAQLCAEQPELQVDWEGQHCQPLPGPEEGDLRKWGTHTGICLPGQNILHFMMNRNSRSAKFKQTHKDKSSTHISVHWVKVQYCFVIDSSAIAKHFISNMITWVRYSYMRNHRHAIASTAFVFLSRFCLPSYDKFWLWLRELNLPWPDVISALIFTHCNTLGVSRVNPPGLTPHKLSFLGPKLATAVTVYLECVLQTFVVSVSL